MQLATLQADGSSLDENSLRMFAEKLRETPVHPDIEKILAFFSDIEPLEIIEKTLSYIISREQFENSERIGYDEDELHNMLEAYTHEQKQSSGNKKRKRRR
jgi:hypothetical protein